MAVFDRHLEVLFVNRGENEGSQSQQGSDVSDFAIDKCKGGVSTLSVKRLTHRR